MASRVSLMTTLTTSESNPRQRAEEEYDQADDHDGRPDDRGQQHAAEGLGQAGDDTLTISKTIPCSRLRTRLAALLLTIPLVVLQADQGLVRIVGNMQTETLAATQQSSLKAKVFTSHGGKDFPPRQ